VGLFCLRHDEGNMTPYFFGYGSLVNSTTHHYPDTRTAEIVGWRRHWVQTPHPTAVLSVHAAPGESLKGLVAAVPDADWEALDKRERGYKRIGLELETAAIGGGPVASLSVYQAFDSGTETEVKPILRSYLDCVLQGYLHRFGEEGLAHFMASTDRWDTPIRDDRDNPVYVRAVSLSDKENRLIEAALAPVLS
jgi:hypothetical protein